MIKIKKLLCMILTLLALTGTTGYGADQPIRLHRPTIEEFFQQSTRGFTDTQGHWAEQAIYEAVDLGYVSGTSDTLFSPELPMTRAMLVTMLYRMAGSPSIVVSNPFTDVPRGSWYEKPVLWTVEKGISYGQTETIFGVNGSASRETIATMLYRYARNMGYDVGDYSDTTRFVDSGEISPASKAAVSWALANQLISGKENQRLDPKGTATRAEVVAIVIRFLHLQEEQK